MMRCTSFRCEAGFGSTDFSLCAFPLVRKPKSHRLKSLCYLTAPHLRSVCTQWLKPPKKTQILFRA
jgi:hypothetical protein